MKTVNLERVVHEGAPLLRAGGEEYSYQICASDEDRRLQALKQRRILLHRVCGIDSIWNTGEDQLAIQMLPNLNRDHIRTLASEIEKSEEFCREENEKKDRLGVVKPLKRKATDLLHLDDERRRKVDRKALRVESSDIILEHIAKLVTDLFESIFDARWEIRHGAFTALRLLFIQLTAKETHSPGPSMKVPQIQDAWLQECLIRSMCVLALDQFADYSSDCSVAPVRDICAQVFGILLGYLSDHSILLEYFQGLRHLLLGATWHAWHGGLLGLKYLIRAHPENAERLLPLLMNDILDPMIKANAALNGNSIRVEEDVVAVAISMLEDSIEYSANVEIEKLVRALELLWSLLAGYQSQSASILPAAMVGTFSAWFNSQPLNERLRPSMSSFPARSEQLVRLTPFLHHPTTAVRLATAKCFIALCTLEKEGLSEESDLMKSLQSALHYCLSHLLLQILLERDEVAAKMVSDAWRSLLRSIARPCMEPSSDTAAAFHGIVSNLATVWLEILQNTANIHVLDILPPSLDSALNGEASAFSCTRDDDGSLVAYAEALGFMGSRLWTESRAYCAMQTHLLQGLSSLSGQRQSTSLLVLMYWAEYARKDHESSYLDTPNKSMYRALRFSFGSLVEQRAREERGFGFGSHEHYLKRYHAADEYDRIAFIEVHEMLQRAFRMCKRLTSIFHAANVPIPQWNTSNPYINDSVLSAAKFSRELAEFASSLSYNDLGKKEEYELAHFKRQDLFTLDEAIQQVYTKFYNRVRGLECSAYCRLLPLPSKKPGFLVKALMNTLKCEASPDYQKLAAQILADFIIAQSADQRGCVAKIVENLCHSAMSAIFQEDVEFKRDDEANTALNELQIRIRGAEQALSLICKGAGANIFVELPNLEALITDMWNADLDKMSNTDVFLRQRSHLLQFLTQHVDDGAFITIVPWIESGLAGLLFSQSVKNETSRMAIAKAIASICAHSTSPSQETAIEFVYMKIFSAVGASVSSDQSMHGYGPFREHGAIAVLHAILHRLKSSITPFVPSLTHLAMQSMSSQDESTRNLATASFADLVPLMSLQMDLEIASSNDESPLVGEMRQLILDHNEKSRTFLESLVTGKCFEKEDAQPILACDAVLRDYQQDGINWLSFLIRYNLHGILADDMGLGKTLQMLAAIVLCFQKLSSSPNPEPLVALVICPPIVATHWALEARKRFANAFDDIIEYSGTSATRRQLRKQLDPHFGPNKRLIVASYAVIRTEIEYWKEKFFTFLVLDEAHLIRNTKSCAFAAMVQLHARHRFALTGTPIQNQVADLWSLFQILMPGYLGPIANFRRSFVNPITQSRNKNANAKQKELAALAITQLHDRVSPFILRRTKQQVLKELPPKIISDILVPATALQSKLYQHIRQAELSNSSIRPLQTTSSHKIAGVFQQLQLLQKICIHPNLIISSQKHQHLNLLELVDTKTRSSMADWRHSGKFTALRDLLHDACGFSSDDNDQDETEPSLSPTHRCLIFSHLQETLDYVEHMFEECFPRLTYTRLRSTLTNSVFHEKCRNFNEDPSIDILLLTTSIGGLGLTLTGADTVIFLEHSWNPFVDLQAMDRAHRLGQTKSVRVFRLIMQNTLEEEILNLQSFKQQVASSVIADASHTQQHNYDILSLLRNANAEHISSDCVKEGGTLTDAETDGLPRNLQKMVQELGALWDESQYKALDFPLKKAS
uniref:Uncharacterized protein AlNc14C1G32 n=1 Tax=Albugo laibachii Nc14 TaxID=890382 RepID=F0VYN0_9STRA|nr:conserved hypothetical protein [Albugo laibachii Nc14]|eukprot:CCA13894.1 conserved hypothetical protein [Albugo laibachii Nc14]